MQPSLSFAIEDPVVASVVMTTMLAVAAAAAALIENVVSLSSAAHVPVCESLSGPALTRRKNARYNAHILKQSQATVADSVGNCERHGAAPRT